MYYFFTYIIIRVSAWSLLEQVQLCSHYKPRNYLHAALYTGIHGSPYIYGSEVNFLRS